ncbi:hypothetical protein ANCCEY_13282 [Ancylostoma ceylanicum]|uniref:Uncharacterized protein n=1 Tax=Ancylostoma ceylanicum TaxID=53326 RepID=A0A0D6LJ19_9BILA|nr:hypothetical protein ANCCEY_13282 [Ancylostoma ceylanicum]
MTTVIVADTKDGRSAGVVVYRLDDERLGSGRIREEQPRGESQRNGYLISISRQEFQMPRAGGCPPAEAPTIHPTVHLRKRCPAGMYSIAATHAIKWLEELHETLLKDYNQIGSAEDDLRYLREDRLKLEDTARSTYEYGRQLCQVALVLRRSLRMDVKNQIGLNEKLEQTWGRLCRALSENEAKLNVTEAFNTTVVEYSLFCEVAVSPLRLDKQLLHLSGER